MSPKQFYALQEKWYQEQQRQDLRSGVLAALIANLFLKKGRKPFRPVDFMAYGGMDEPVSHVQPWQKQLRTAEQLNAFFGGKDLRKKRM